MSKTTIILWVKRIFTIVVALYKGWTEYKNKRNLIIVEQKRLKKEKLIAKKSKTESKESKAKK